MPGIVSAATALGPDPIEQRFDRALPWVWQLLLLPR